MKKMRTTQTVRYSRGFTIVELLVVIVVIAILAAISVVAFTGVQDRANEAVITSDLSNFAKKAEIQRINTGLYPYANFPELETLELRFTQAAYKAGSDISSNIHYCRSDDFKSYALWAIAKNSQNFYVSSDSSSPKEYNGDLSPVTDLCPTIATITGVPVTLGVSGYVESDTINGPWRAWSGISN